MLVAVSVGACGGVGVDRQPVQIDAHGVPFGLLAPSAATTTAPPAPTAAVTVYFVSSTGLRAVSRALSDIGPVDGALEALSSGPTVGEVDEGLTSPVSAAAPLRAEPMREGVVPVDVSASFQNLGGVAQIAAVAQLVFSLTGTPGVSGVVLLVGGRPTRVPTAGGGLASGALTRADYASFAPA